MMEMSKDRRWFYGWVIVFVGFLANFMSMGSGFYIFNAFMEPLCQIRGWSRTDINLAMMMGMFTGMVSSLIYGTIVIRAGSRVLMLGGPFVSGLAFIFLFRVTSLWQFNLLAMLLFLGNGAYGGIVANTVVNNWFETKRGKAMGIATAGVSFSGVILPFMAMILMGNRDLATASLVIGIGIMALGPLAWTLVRNWPEDYGLVPDGGRARPDSSNQVLGQDPYQDVDTHLLSLIKSPEFWQIGLTFVFLATVTSGVMSQLKPRFADQGFTDLTAMTLMMLTALAGTLGKFFWGALCDRYSPKWVVSAMAALNILGLVASLMGNSIQFIVCFIIVYGFTMGGIMSTYPITVSAFFGRKGFARVSRFMAILFLLDLSGFIIAGQSYDRFGSYDVAYMIFILLDVMAMGLILSVSRSGNPS